MQRSRAVVLTLVAALIFGLLASMAIYSYLKQQQQEAQRARGEQQLVVVAAMDIPAGESLSQERVRTVMWPKTSLPPGVIFDPSLAIGRLAVKDLVVGEPVLESKLAAKDVLTGVMTFLIPQGKRAVTVGVDPVSGVSGFILPNSHIDLIVTTQLPTGAKISRTALQNIRVLAVGQIMDQKDGKPVPVTTVTLAVTPEEAEKLAFANSEGRLQLVLRKFGDQEVVPTKGVTLGRLMLSPEAPAEKRETVARVSKTPRQAAPAQVVPSAPPRATTHSIEIIRSSKGGVQKTDQGFIQNSEGGWEKK
jgi:pilus assembly protein CpaB